MKFGGHELWLHSHSKIYLAVYILCLPCALKSSLHLCTSSLLCHRPSRQPWVRYSQSCSVDVVSPDRIKGISSRLSLPTTVTRMPIITMARVTYTTATRSRTWSLVRIPLGQTPCRTSGKILQHDEHVTQRHAHVGVYSRQTGHIPRPRSEYR